MECALVLRYFGCLAKHLARSGKVDPAVRLKITECGEHILGALDIGLHGRELVRKAVRHETLRRQMVAFVKFLAGYDPINACIIIN